MKVYVAAWSEDGIPPTPLINLPPEYLLAVIEGIDTGNFILDVGEDDLDLKAYREQAVLLYEAKKEGIIT